ncbi:hypothetical protein [Ktedonobacter robiniae]|uniref:Uncharacterized protein n=1 Tax=Ktedonobacter robiniae TaxID=2778365 RepID=A0ABQ3URF4_9CHLR|nr:hypothetical protein [Ktedonobacter robiniae]GHO55290.1 hypothetical protein KSB_37650 [Ktedonobacter robiniae]
MNIDIKKIGNLDLTTAKTNLEEINEIIDKRIFSRSFYVLAGYDTLYDKVTFDVTEGRPEPHENLLHYWVFRAVPLLLDIKRQLIDHIGLLEEEAKIQDIKDVIKKVQDETVRLKLEDQLDDLQRQTQNQRAQAQEAIKQQESKQAEEEWRLTLRQRTAEVRELEWKLWRSFIERESVSTIIGALLLLIIVAALIIAMFNHVTSPEIINNAFLVILGYFFGQTVGKVEAKNKSDREKD